MNGKFKLLSGVESQDGTSSQNIAEGIAFDRTPRQFDFFEQVNTSLIAGLKYTSKYVNKLVAISCETDATGANRLAVSTSAPLSTTAIAPSVSSVGVASASIIGARATRRAIVLTNDSANIIYLGFGTETAVVGRGIRINANGGQFIMEYPNIWTGAFTGIATGAGSGLCVQQFD